jgi:quercetin dioxygenase-like cupin family protein
MAKAGEMLTHSVTGSRLIFVKTAAETGGEYLEVEQIVRPNADLLPPHVHIVQTETFHIISGTVNYQIHGRNGILQAGDEVSFPPGTPHKNPVPATDEDLHMRVTITPALDFHVILEAVLKAPERGYAEADGSTNKIYNAMVLNSVRSTTYLAGQPLWLQKIMFPVLAFIGRMKGYKAAE